MLFISISSDKNKMQIIIFWGMFYGLRTIQFIDATQKKILQNKLPENEWIFLTN